MRLKMLTIRLKPRYLLPGTKDDSMETAENFQETLTFQLILIFRRDDILGINCSAFPLCDDLWSSTLPALILINSYPHILRNTRVMEHSRGQFDHRKYWTKLVLSLRNHDITTGWFSCHFWGQAGKQVTAQLPQTSCTAASCGFQRNTRGPVLLGSVSAAH